MKANILRNFRFSLVLLFVSTIAIAQSFTISFPAFTTGSAQNPQGLTVCNGNSLLQVQLDVAAVSTTGASISITLPTGVEYVPSSLTTVSSNAGLTISEDGGTANVPKFKINQNNLAAGNRVIFTIRRSAACAARTFILGGGTFKDTVAATIDGATTSEQSSTYQVNYPVFSLIQPATQTNVVVGGSYTRTFTISNGGGGCAQNVYFSIDYPAGGIQQTSLKLTSVNGSVLPTAVTLSPTSTVGTTSYYTVTSANIPGGQFCNGNTLQFTESYKVKVCNATTNYAAGWGCSSAPSSWCQTVTGTGNIAVATGVANFTNFTATRSNFSNVCSQFTETYTFRNGGSGNVTAATMYNAKLRLGGNSIALLGAYDWSYQNILSGTIGSSAVTIVGGTSNGIASIDLKDKFITDPDGAGVGLEDIDGDGFFDDLPAGNTVTLTTIMKLKCDRYVCNENRSGNLYGVYADIQYNTMCDGTTVATSTKLISNTSGIANSQIVSVADLSYAPANIDNNIPFKSRFAVGHFTFTDAFDTANTRYIYEITLPAGLTLSGAQPTVVWHRGQYPASINNNSLIATVSQTGNVITVTSPDQFIGWFELNMIYNCAAGPGGTNIPVPYKLKKIYDITAPACICNPEIFCGNLILGRVQCPGNCTNGPFNTLSKVERENNSLGWTDGTLSTRQSRANISDFDLSKILYLDDFLIKGNATQKGSATNLYLYTSIKKLAGTDNKISAKSIDITIRRGGTILVNNVNSTNFSTTGTNTSQQVITWDFTSLLPSGGLIEGDLIETVAHYSTISANLPLQDEQTGKELYFFNIDGANNRNFCNIRTPEMYLAGTSFIDANNGGQQLSSSACTAFIPGGSTNYLARRFSSSGSQYLNEVRPGFLPTKYTVTVDNSYAVNSISIVPQNPSGSPMVLTPTSQSGNTYTFNLPAVTYPILVTNNYNVRFDVNISPTCATPANAPSGIVSKVDYIDYYYHYKDLLPAVAPSSLIKTLALTYDTSTRPTIGISNQSGVIQASKASESFIIRMASTGTSTAPYTWLSIPTNAGVNVTQIVDIATNTILTPITYSGGVWFKLSAAGLASGTSKNYRLDFTYTTCVATTFQVEGGWNCTSYPTDPSQYLCGKSSVDLTFIPQNGEVQILTVNQPTVPVNLCTPIDYEFRINSASAGNIVNNTFGIILPQGLAFVPNTLQVEYPANSGNWQTVTSTVSGNTTTVNLTGHSAYPTQGLPGTLNDGGNPNLRLMGIRFKLITDCTFIIGSNISVTTKANKTCGIPAIGDGVLLAANSIQVDGANPPYKVVTAITVPGGFNDCSDAITVRLDQTIITNTSTSATGYVKVFVPTGYDYIANSFVCNSTNCPTFAGVFTDTITNEKYVRLNIPGGLATGTNLNYDLKFQPNSGVVNGSYILKVITQDELSGLSCPTATGGTCSSVVVQTGASNLNYTLTCSCFNDPQTTGTALDTKHGITLLQKAGANNGGWPMIRKGAHTALESNSKGFVVTRMTSEASQAGAVNHFNKITNPQDGMMVYDTFEKCLKIYTVDDVTPSNSAWKCYTVPACP